MEEPNEPTAPEQVSPEPQGDPQPPTEPQVDPQPVEPGSGHRLINLPALLSDEFGVSPQTVQNEILLGQLEIDGEPYTGRDKINIEHREIAGKTITVKGQTRSFQLAYQDVDPPPVGEQRTVTRRGY